MANSIKFYKDENLPPNQIEKLNEAWNLYISFFRDDFPKWISRNEILNLRSFENMVFVFTVFEGTAFDHLKCKSRIISANCLLMTLKTQRKLPRSLMPIYSLAMTEMNVCCTNIEKDLRQEIYDKVEMMQGNVSKILAETVTHLITTEVGSAKYHAAAGMRIPVMLPDWILELWKRSDTEDIHGSNEEYLHKYRCPIFNKYVICASGFDEETKQKIKYLVESEGGIYNGVLQFATTTHLIINEPKGAKFEHAKEWRINTVKPEWVYESIQAGYCLYEKNYQLRSATQVLTPSDNRVLKSRANIDNSLMNNSPMNNSLINNSLNFNSPKCLNEMDTNNGFNKHSNPLLNTVYNNNTNKNNINKPLTNYSDLMKEINSIGKIKLTLFDGIGIYCENFDPLITEKLKKIFNSGGAIRFDEYNSDVTHVIVNQLNDVLCKSYNELNPEVNIVTIDWLINSCKNNDLEDCKEYVVFKNALNSVKTPKKRSRPEKTDNVSAKLCDSDLNDCLSQYLNVEAALMKEKNPMPAPTNLFGVKIEKAEAKPIKPIPKLEKAEETLPSKSLIESRPKSLGNKLFSNKRFQIFGFTEMETQEQENVLLDKDANVIPFDSNISFSSYRNKDIIDYTLLPMTIPAPTSNNNPATIYWVKKCIEKNKLLELDEDVFYQPIPKYNDEKPLTKCVITISGFNNSEKDNITNLCKLLGAHVQQQLCFKDTGDILGNTHLICNKAVGPKYIAAKSWNLPAVGYEWVVDSCVTGIKADEAKYSIENHTNTKELIEALAKIRQNDETITSNYSITSNANRSKALNSSHLQNSINCSITESRKSTSNQERDKSDIADEPNFNDSSLSCHNDSKKPRIDQEDDEKSVNRTNNNQTNNESQETIDDQEDEDEEEEETNEPVLAAIENSSKINKGNNSILNNNRLSTPAAQFATPLNPRLKELRNNEQAASPLTTTSNENNGVLKTPVWMKSGDQSNYKFNFDGLSKEMESFKTPKIAISKNHKARAFPETPLDEVFAKAIRIAGINSQNPAFYQNQHESPAFEYSFEKTPSHRSRTDSAQHKQQSKNDMNPSSQYAETVLKKTKQILKNVKVCVSKKLIKSQNEIYLIAEDLGAEFLWTYNEGCTHFIHNGKLNDSSKDLKCAREQNKIIVSPNWIYACKEQLAHADESLFALTLNTAKMSTKSPFVSRNQSSQIPSLEFVETKQINSKPDPVTPNETVETVTKIEKQNEDDIKYEEELKPDGEEEKEEESKAVAFPEPPEPHIIPDSMDIKFQLLDKLQDKLASMRNQPVGPKKWARNNSANFSSNLDTNDSDTTPNETRKSDSHYKDDQTNNADETVLSEQQALNELNISRSKWGINSGGQSETNIEKRKRTKSFSENTDRNINNENDDSDMNMLNSFMGKQTDEAKKLTSNLKRKEPDNDLKTNSKPMMDEPNSPSLVNIKQKKFSYADAPVSSQIQVTMWKEDQNIPSTAARKKSTQNTKANDQSAIAERFITVSRASAHRK